MIRKKCKWETIYLNSQGFVCAKTKATSAVTALVPEDRITDLPNLHYEVIEALHFAAKEKVNPGEVIPQLFKRTMAV